jgi:hypothetical protein
MRAFPAYEAPERMSPEEYTTYFLADSPFFKDSDSMESDTVFKFPRVTAELASLEYHERDRNPTVANIAKIVITTMSSTSVKAEIRRKNFFRTTFFFTFSIRKN